MGSKIGVIVVDDSATVRRILTDIIERHPLLRVSASVADPYEAVEILKVQSPDVMVLDVQMPRMNGVTFLEKLMKIKPMPVVMCSSFTKRGSALSLQCLENGAVDIIAKPKSATPRNLRDLETRIHETLLSAAVARFLGVKMDLNRRQSAASVAESLSADALLPPPNVSLQDRIPKTSPVIAVGASTGGVDAIRAFLEPMPVNCPGIAIVQHMPEKFTESFANRLNDQCKITVREAKAGDTLEPGLALIAPGSHHLLLKRSGTRYTVEVVEGPLVNRHRPSVDVLFRSVAIAAGKNAVGVILTGMGEDGAAGLVEMKNAGARTIAQDESSCVVFGMPKEAIARGGAGHVFRLDRISPEILKRMKH